jgi:hypothetical protein
MVWKWLGAMNTFSVHCRSIGTCVTAPLRATSSLDRLGLGSIVFGRSRKTTIGAKTASRVGAC